MTVSTGPCTGRALHTSRGHQHRRAHTGGPVEPPLASLGRTPRERAILAQMGENPRVRYSLVHGAVPPWMDLAIAAQEAGRPSLPAGEPAPPRVPASRAGTSSLPRRPASHRKPRRRIGWAVASHGLAVLAGAIGCGLLGFL
ncbi:hypothetical protein OUQ99_29975 [Streptomonospora nanhaiensis]|uniref:Uncharacterized protein n=1 Tax=Streptomonospora nanhaiensis TaxID=1323731 RepID=A0ABY6YM77_9ACTN|nr:hypothetical protein [Streptomonospora nanhaiensis]WAE73323.1 hypothetical protein OUQ99_29975 [Streptomonospora nanhaiensis]